MNYVDIDDLQEAFRSLVAGVTIGDAKAFRDVVTSHATDTGQLLEEMEAAMPPAAIIGLGDVEYDERGVLRTLRPVIVVMDVFRKGGIRRSSGVWTLAGAVEALFQPNLAAVGDYREVSGIEFHLSGLQPLALSERLAAVAIALEGVEYI